MESIWRRVAGIATVVMMTACSGPSGTATLHAAERAAMTPLKASYPDVVMGFGFHGTTVDVSIDLNALLSMDEDAEAAMKAKTVTQWQTTWRASHPHRHGTLTVRFIDFHGHPDFTATTKA